LRRDQRHPDRVRLPIPARLRAFIIHLIGYDPDRFPKRYFLMRARHRGGARRSHPEGDAAEKNDFLQGELREVVAKAFATAAAEEETAAPVAPMDDPAGLPAEPAVALTSTETVATPPPLAEPAAPLETPSPAAAVPAEPLPARMLNEFVYCPRLFYYEHVEGVFAENADTTRGAAVHARVDKGSGALPVAENLKSSTSDESAEATIEKIHSRSVTLGSERLRVIAKLDLAEVTAADAGELPSPVAPADGGEQQDPEGAGNELFSRLRVCPVDYKAGAPRTGDDGNELWPTDKMQLGLQILLLRDNGYQCDRGVIYYRATKQRVPLEMTRELEEWITAQIAAARLTMTGPIPPPLVGSPKCVRCSLNAICLPDETRLLAEIAEGERGESHDGAERLRPDKIEARTATATPPLRRLIAPRDDTRVLYLNKPGVRVGRKDELLVVKDEDKTLDEIRISDLSHVALFGNIQISSQAVQVLCEKEIPLTYFSMGGWFYGITRGHELKNVFTRMEQFRLARDPLVCLQLARRMIFGKIRNHRTMLMRLHLEPPEPVVLKLKTMADSALGAESIGELLGTEGAAAHFYFSAFAGMFESGGRICRGRDCDRAAVAFQFCRAQPASADRSGECDVVACLQSACEGMHAGGDGGGARSVCRVLSSTAFRPAGAGPRRDGRIPSADCGIDGADRDQQPDDFAETFCACGAGGESDERGAKAVFPCVRAADECADHASDFRL
jgi:CRISPR-associated protein Cas1